jgi:hypothetical protein
MSLFGVLSGIKLKGIRKSQVFLNSEQPKADFPFFMVPFAHFGQVICNGFSTLISVSKLFFKIAIVSFPLSSFPKVTFR